MTTQLALTPVIKGQMIFDVIQEIASVCYDNSYQKNITILEKQYKEIVEDEKL